MFKTGLIICGLAACGGGSSHHLADSNGRDTNGGDSGVVYPCAIHFASTLVTVDSTSTGGTCTPTSLSEFEFGIMFSASGTGGASVTGEMGCHLSDATIPQTIGLTTGTAAGCSNIEVDVTSATGGGDSWDTSQSATATLTITNLQPISGMIAVMFSNDSNNMGITGAISGTF